MTIDSTVTKTEAPPFVKRAVGSTVIALFLFFFGIVLFIIPIIGWILGPLTLLTSIGMFFQMFNTRPTYIANCPYCSTSGGAGNPGVVSKCIHCKNRFVHRDGKLWKIEK